MPQNNDMKQQGETALERADRLQRKAAEIQSRALLNAVIATLRIRGDVVQGVAQSLISNGAMTVDHKPIPLGMAPPRRASSGRLLALEDSQSAGHAEPAVPRPERAAAEVDSAAASRGSEHLKRNGKNWGSIGNSNLRVVLIEIEPTAFSGNNLRALTKRGSIRDVPMDKMLQLLEAATDFTDGTGINMSDRNMERLKILACEANIRNGRRMKDAVLRPDGLGVDWANGGIYLWWVEANTLTVYDRTTLLGRSVFVQEGDLFDIDMNWSAAKAMIRQTAGSGGLAQNCYSFIMASPKKIDLSPGHQPKRARITRSLECSATGSSGEHLTSAASTTLVLRRLMTKTAAPSIGSNDSPVGVAPPPSAIEAQLNFVPIIPASSEGEASMMAAPADAASASATAVVASDAGQNGTP